MCGDHLSLSLCSNLSLVTRYLFCFVIFICKIIQVEGDRIGRKGGVLKRVSTVDQCDRLELLEDGCTGGGGMEGS